MENARMANSKYIVTENGKDVYKALGIQEFLFCGGEKSSEGKVKIVRYDKNFLLKSFSGTDEEKEKQFDERFTFALHDIMDGKDFLKQVNDGYFTASDGYVTDIFVNGFRSNLAFYHDAYGHFGNGFLVDNQTFEKMCDTFDIEVNWKSK